jgi:hypothetical protein
VHEVCQARLRKIPEGRWTRSRKSEPVDGDRLPRPNLLKENAPRPRNESAKAKAAALLHPAIPAEPPEAPP